MIAGFAAHFGPIKNRDWGRACSYEIRLTLKRKNSVLSLTTHLYASIVIKVETHPQGTARSPAAIAINDDHSRYRNQRQFQHTLSRKRYLPHQYRICRSQIHHSCFAFAWADTLTFSGRCADTRHGLDSLVDQTIGYTFSGRHEAVAIGIRFDLRECLSGVLE